MKSSGAAWRETLTTVLENELGFKNCVADPDLWMKEGTKKDGEDYYIYICVYVDDLLCIAEDPRKYIMEIKDHFHIREDSIEPPKMYLGADTKLVRTSQGDEFWCTGANSYLKEATRIVQEKMKEYRVQVKGKGCQPYSFLSYRPELDLSPFCNEEQTQLYQFFIGMLRWAVELGRIDMLQETSQMSCYMANPLSGHLHQLFHIFHNLKNHMSSWLPMCSKRGSIRYVWSGIIKSEFSLIVVKIYKTWKKTKPLKIVFRGLASVVDIY